MKLIFLDVDGVLNYSHCEASVGGFCGVEPEKVKLLKQIVDATGAKLVLSSTWRRHIPVGIPLEAQTDPFACELLSKLADEGLKLYDMTSTEIEDGNRKKQITALIDRYVKSGQPVESWVVLDDDIFDGFTEKDFKKHFVKTSFYDRGLCESHVKKAICILNGSEDENSGLFFLEPMLVPQGWGALVEALDKNIEEWTETGDITGFSVVDFKEKYGELRLYYDCHCASKKVRDDFDEMIEDYAYVSGFTCANCGAFPVGQTAEGWTLPLCEKCADGRPIEPREFDVKRHFRRYDPKKGWTEEERNVSDVIRRVGLCRKESEDAKI